LASYPSIALARHFSTFLDTSTASSRADRPEVSSAGEPHSLNLNLIQPEEGDTELRCCLRVRVTQPSLDRSMRKYNFLQAPMTDLCLAISGRVFGKPSYKTSIRWIPFPVMEG
jgi:hypothetical protein